MLQLLDASRGCPSGVDAGDRRARRRTALALRHEVERLGAARAMMPRSMKRRWARRLERRVDGTTTGVENGPRAGGPVPRGCRRRRLASAATAADATRKEERRARRGRWRRERARTPAWRVPRPRSRADRRPRSSVRTCTTWTSRSRSLDGSWGQSLLDGLSRRQRLAEDASSIALADRPGVPVEMPERKRSVEFLAVDQFESLVEIHVFSPSVRGVPTPISSEPLQSQLGNSRRASRTS